MTGTPAVLLIAWRRPDQTRRVLEAIRLARPEQLFVAVDGPRATHPDEAVAVASTRAVIEAAIDWPCEVRTRFSTENAGCRIGVSSAIDWFFEHVSEGIILEDDCLPHPEFFPYCAELLDRYRDDARVMHIGGDNSIDVTWDGSDSYRFMRWPQVWGWATWRRAWHRYDRDLDLWADRIRGRRGRRILDDPVTREVWIPLLANLRRTGEPDTWDYQWVATMLLHDGLAVIPRHNLVSNIGFGPGAAHTLDGHPRASRATHPILPLHHPDAASIDPFVDRMVLDRAQGGRKAAARIAERQSVRGRIRTIRRTVRRLGGRALRLMGLRRDD